MPFNNYCKEKTGEYFAVAKGKAGLNPKLSLPESCADFYVLERLVSDGYPPASAALSAFEDKLAAEFSSYLDIAIGGELRHVWHVYDESNCDDCEGDGYIYCNECCGTGTAECYTCYGSVDCTDCDGSGKIPCDECDGEGQYDCQECSYSPGRVNSWEDLVDPRLGKFINKVITRKGHGGKIWSDERALAWDQWVHIRHIYGLDAVKMAVECYENEEIWSGGGFGGSAWASCARLLYDYLSNKITKRVFINMAWSLEHNGGCIFNKVYNETSRLAEVLQVQSISPKYDEPVKFKSHQRGTSKERLLDSCSQQVKNAWSNFGYVKSTKQGQRWLGEHQLAIAAQRLAEAENGWATMGWQVKVDNLRALYWTSE